MRSGKTEHAVVSFILTFLLLLPACSKKELRSIPVSSIVLNESSIQLKVGEDAHLEVSIKPDGATNKTVKWSSSNPAVVSVNDGLVEAVSIGEAVIVAEADRKTAKCTIKVISAFVDVESIKLDNSNVSLKAGETIELTAAVNPSNATDKSVTWTSSNPPVATVENGTVKAIKVGSATITAKAGDKTATCFVTVEATPVTSITLDKTTALLRSGQTVTLNAAVNPSDATDKTITWTSSNPSVATVENGVVKAIMVGNATITAKAGDKTATCSITVESTPVTSITLNKISASLRAGQSITLTATVNPSDATDMTVTWSSSNPLVATVENGVVKAINVGNVTITAKAGDKTATCSVTVEATPVTSIALDRTAASLRAGQSITLTATVNPSDATDKTVTWTSSNPSVATVENGTVKAVKVGSATITAKAGDKVAVCTIMVKPTSGGFEDVSEEVWS